MSRDPLGMWGDAGNRGTAQNYCGNNPVNRLDPLGLAQLDLDQQGKLLDAIEKRLDADLPAKNGTKASLGGAAESVRSNLRHQRKLLAVARKLKDRKLQDDMMSNGKLRFVDDSDGELGDGKRAETTESGSVLVNLDENKTAKAALKKGDYDAAAEALLPTLIHEGYHLLKRHNRKAGTFEELIRREAEAWWIEAVYFDRFIGGDLNPEERQDLADDLGVDLYKEFLDTSVHRLKDGSVCHYVMGRDWFGIALPVLRRVYDYYKKYFR